LVCLPARGTSQATGKKCTVTGYGYMGESKYSAKTTFILLFTPATLLAKSAQSPDTDTWAKVFSKDDIYSLLYTIQVTGKKCTVTGYRYVGESKYSAKTTFILLLYTSQATGKKCTVTEYGYMGESKLLIKADICSPFYTSQVLSKKFMAIGFGKLKAKTTFYSFRFIQS
jgi:hypothetical protein